MSETRNVELFTAGCAVCEQVVEMVQSLACTSCDVQVRDMHDPQVAARAADLGVKSVPAVVIDGRLADCCTGRGPDAQTLQAAGLGLSQ